MPRPVQHRRVRDKIHQAIIHAHGHLRAADAAYQDDKPALAKHFVFEASMDIKRVLDGLVNVEAKFCPVDLGLPLETRRG